jgi:hypothetical protein
MKKMDKKGLDTRAINLIIAVPIIFIAIMLFYLWAGKNGIEKQEIIIKGNLEAVKVDETLADWIRARPQDMLSTDTMQSSFKSWFQSNGFTVDSISCESNRCEFKLKRGKPQYVSDYQRTIYLPATNIREIRFVGKLNYE